MGGEGWVDCLVSRLLGAHFWILHDVGESLG